MNALPNGIEKSSKNQKFRHRQQGRRVIKTLLSIAVLSLAAWPLWNWVMAPLLTLPTFTYLQMMGIVSLVGVTTLIFSGAERREERFRRHHPGTWTRSACRRSAES